MGKNEIEKISEQIAKETLDAINPDRWSGRNEIPDNIDTTTYIDKNEFNIKNDKSHIESYIEIDDNSKPVLHVNLVSNDNILSTCKSNTINSTHILSLMIQYVLQVSTKNKE